MMTSFEFLTFKPLKDAIIIPQADLIFD